MAIAGNLALLAGAKGRLGKSRFAGAASTPVAVSIRRSGPSPAPLLRLPPLGRSAAAGRSLAVVRVARRNVSDRGDSTLMMDGVNVQRVAKIAVLFMGIQTSKKAEIKRKFVWMLFFGLIMWIAALAIKWRRAVLLAAIS